MPEGSKLLLEVIGSNLALVNYDIRFFERDDDD